MPNLSIGLSGLRVAQQGLELVGTNIANASTEGYHRQSLRVVPRQFGTANNAFFGGAEAGEVRRAIDDLLELELYRQQPELAQIGQELSALKVIEGSLGSLDANALAKSINQFFAALQELAFEPSSAPLQEQAVWAADTLASQFRNMSNYLFDLQQHVLLEAQHAAERVNSLSAEIAQLNQEIQTLALRGGNTNLLADRRDMAICELAELVDTQTHKQFQSTNVVNVSAWGTPLVTAGTPMEIEVARTADGKLGVSPKGTGVYATDYRGGKLGGLLALNNELLPEITKRLDTLSQQLINSINRLHVQGTGPAGSFTSLSGWQVSSQALSTWQGWGASLGEGDLYIRVTDNQTGTVSRHKVEITAGDDIEAISDKIKAAAGQLDAFVSNSVLCIEATDPNRYSFDFLPCPLAEFDPLAWSEGNTASVELSGTFTGPANTTYTVTVVNGGRVGLDDDLSLQVSDADGQVIKTLYLGQQYAPGLPLELADGIKLASSSGTLVAGDSFTVQAIANSDTSGILAAAGMNTLFSGYSAMTMSVCKRVLESPGLLACSVEPASTDNINLRRMAAVGEQKTAALGDVTPIDHFRLTVTSIGQKIATRQARYDSLENVIVQLTNQRDVFSGVDVNEEAAKMLVFEQMFQALAKFISAQQKATEFLLNTL